MLHLNYKCIIPIIIFYYCNELLCERILILYFPKMISDRIKSLREQKGLTQSMLARKIGITRSSVNAWEMGVSTPSTQYLIDLSELFNVSTDYLLGFESTSTISVDGLDEEDIQLMHALVEHLREK